MQYLRDFLFGLQPDSCGYGIIATSVFPNGHFATLDRGSPVLAGLPQGGCGACIQVTCTDPAAVSTSSSKAGLSFCNVLPNLFEAVTLKQMHMPYLNGKFGKANQAEFEKFVQFKWSALPWHWATKPKSSRSQQQRLRSADSGLIALGMALQIGNDWG